MFLLALLLSLAPGSVWDDLAQCESGGNWSYNGSSGFDGGLQFSPASWTAMGGPTQYAWQASRAQQIAVAQRLWEVQGWGAWPGCARKLGLYGINPTQQTSQVDAINDAPEIDPDLADEQAGTELATLSVEVADGGSTEGEADGSGGDGGPNVGDDPGGGGDSGGGGDADEASLPVTE